MEKISVIVPIYNSEKTLPRCIDSILAQSHTNLEVLLINDGSSDTSLDICRQYALQDSRIRVLDKQNGGVSSARNLGLDVAEGDYIAFVDADDELVCNAYEFMLNKSKEMNADMTFCQYVRIKESGKKLFVKEPLSRLQTFDLHPFYQTVANKTIMGSTWRILFRCEIAKKYRFDESLHWKEDLLYTLKCIDYSNTISYLDEFLYIYYEPTPFSRKYVKENNIKQIKELYAKINPLLEKKSKSLSRKVLFESYSDSICLTIRYDDDYKTEIRKINSDPFFQKANMFLNFVSALRNNSMKAKIRLLLIKTKQYRLIKKLLR